MAIQTLADITEIQTGYHFPQGVSSDANSPYRVVQPKDISSMGNLSRVALHKLTPAHTPKEPQPAHFLHKGDLLFISRMNPRAVLVSDDFENVIASSHFFIIRIQHSVLRPDYLFWLLNQKETRAQLLSLGQRSTILSVTKAALQSLEIEVPPLALQDKVAALHRLSREYQTKHEQLQQSLETLIQAVTTRALSNAEKGPRP